jgi:uncharacterized membrane protein YukC
MTCKIKKQHLAIHLLLALAEYLDTRTNVSLTPESMLFHAARLGITPRPKKKGMKNILKAYHFLGSLKSDF